jgi:hypothetical protein
MLYSATGKLPAGVIPPSQIPIGWNGKLGRESSATGVEVHMPELREQYVRIMKYETVRSSAWRRRIASCIGKVNSGAFKGWNRGEVMFLGCSYQTPQDNDSKVKVTFEFLIRINETNAIVSGINIGNIYGHEYVWAVQDNYIGAASDNNIKYIFCAQVADFADFDILGV